MDEGSALLHHLERNFNQCLTCIVTHGTIVPPNYPPNRKDAVCLIGTDRELLEKVEGHLKGTISAWGHSPSFCPIMIDGEDNDSNFHGARHVAICLDAESVSGSSELCLIGHTYRHCRLRKANVILLLYHKDYKAPGSRNGSPTSRLGPSPVYSLMENNPELRILQEKCRVHTVYGGKERVLSKDDEDVVRLWIQGKLSNDSENLNHMEYSDLTKIFCREMRQYLPNLSVFLRLLAMSIIGALSVLLTLILIVLIIKEPNVTKDIEHAREYLQKYIVDQRSGKCEWGHQYNAIALTALQIENPSWCFDSVDRQRSVDRMEISLLASLTKLGQPNQKELTAMQLAYYINALWATYQNPRHFHDHNLLTVLDKYLSQISPYVEYNGFAHSICLTALCNTGFPVRQRYWERLIENQRPDGSFALGMDETSLVVIALSCAPNNTQIDIDNTVRKAITYLAVNRQKDGSYGSVYTTALVLQAFHVSNSKLESKQMEQTLAWLTWYAHRSPLVKNIDIAAHVLIALSGKTLLSIKTPTESSRKLATTISPPQRPVTSGRKTDTYKYIRPDPKPGAVGIIEDKTKKEQPKYDDVLIEFLDEKDNNQQEVENNDMEENLDVDSAEEEQKADSKIDYNQDKNDNNQRIKKTENKGSKSKYKHEKKLDNFQKEVTSSTRKKIRKKNKKKSKSGQNKIKKGHMEFSSGSGIDIEELIAEDMYDDVDEVDDIIHIEEDRQIDDTEQKDEDRDLKEKDLKKQYTHRVRRCPCRTMNIYHPLYVLFNMCPVIPKGCP